MKYPFNVYQTKVEEHVFWIAEIPALNGCVGQGETADEALKEVTLHEALGGFLNGWAFRKDGKIYVVYVSEEYDNNKDSSLGKLFYYDGVKVDIGIGLQKSFGDSMNEAESYLENNEDAIKNAINDYLN